MELIKEPLLLVVDLHFLEIGLEAHADAHEYL